MSMPTLAEVVAAIQDVAGAVTGIQSAPDTPPDQIPGAGAIAICFPAGGTVQEVTAGRLRGDHILHLMVATPARNLRTDWDRMIGFGDTIPKAILAGGTLSATVLQTTEIPYTFGPMEWAGQQYFGWIFELKVITAGTLA